MLGYGQSKLANVLFALELAEREKEVESNVLVNVINPGMRRRQEVEWLYDYLVVLLVLTPCQLSF